MTDEKSKATVEALAKAVDELGFSAPQWRAEYKKENQMSDLISKAIDKTVADIMARRTEILEQFTKAYLVSLEAPVILSDIELVEQRRENEVVWFFRKRELP